MKTLLVFCLGVLAANPFAELVDLYERFGGKKYMICEEIVQTEHVLQAAKCAVDIGAPEDIIVALLFHDIGQVCEPEDAGNVDVLHASHADRGGAWLKKRGFPERVWQCVRFHDLAKVILCAEEMGYFKRLSMASKESYWPQKRKYEVQPDVMRVFMMSPWREEWLAARRCDDMAKEAGKVVPGFAFYREMVERVLSGNGRVSSNADWKEAAANRQRASWSVSYQSLVRQ